MAEAKIDLSGLFNQPRVYCTKVQDVKAVSSKQDDGIIIKNAHLEGFSINKNPSSISDLKANESDSITFMNCGFSNLLFTDECGGEFINRCGITVFKFCDFDNVEFNIFYDSTKFVNCTCNLKNGKEFDLDTVPDGYIPNGNNGIKSVEFVSCLFKNVTFKFYNYETAKYDFHTIKESTVHRKEN